jgi:hypothetical protein
MLVLLFLLKRSSLLYFMFIRVVPLWALILRLNYLSKKNSVGKYLILPFVNLSVHWFQQKLIFPSSFALHVQHWL